MDDRLLGTQRPLPFSLTGGGSHYEVVRLLAAGSMGTVYLGLSRLLPPAQLLNADRAAVLLADAIAADSRLLIIGDFDADGALDGLFAGRGAVGLPPRGAAGLRAVVAVRAPGGRERG